MNAVSKINKFLRWLPWAVLIGLFAFMVYYNYTLQNQIYERDAIIRNLAFSDSLVNKYFDVKMDSIHSFKTYSLKDEYGPKEIHHHTTETIRETYTEYVEDTLALNYKQNQLIAIVEKYNTLVGDYKTLIQETKEISDKMVSLSDSMQMQKMALSLIKRNFDIDFKGSISNGKIQVEINCEKADSAFKILPYYRDKLKYNPSKKMWEIKK